MRRHTHWWEKKESKMITLNNDIALDVVVFKINNKFIYIIQYFALSSPYAKVMQFKDYHALFKFLKQTF